MAAREDRELWIMMHFVELVSVYTRTQLTEGTSNGCIHLDPVHLLFHHHPSKVLLALETTDNQESFCVLLSVYHPHRQE